MVSSTSPSDTVFSGVALSIATPDDASDLLGIYAPYVRDTSITFEYEVPSVDEFARRIAATLERYPYLIARGSDGSAVGYAYVGPFKARAAYDWAVETSIYVAQQACGHHIGIKLHQALRQICCLQGIKNLEACIAVPDEGGSVGFHERMGYRMVGRFERCGYKNDMWWDMVWMELLIGEHDGAPAPLIPFPEVRDEAETLLMSDDYA